MSKLLSYGVSSPSLQWFESFLSNRQHSTVIGDANSSTLRVNAGVPQGSVLGPSLFSVLVNDLPSACGLDCTTILLANDTTVYVVGSSVTKISQTLSSALNNCCDWMSRSLLHLNLQKPNPCSSICLLYTSPSPRDRQKSRMPSSA